MQFVKEATPKVLRTRELCQTYAFTSSFILIQAIDLDYRDSLVTAHFELPI